MKEYVCNVCVFFFNTPEHTLSLITWGGLHLSFTAEQHPVVIFAMFCSLFQIVVSFFERINMHLKENFLSNAKISFKFEWINWFLKHWSQYVRFSSAYSFAYNFLSLIHNSPKWRHYVSGEPAALKWCIYCPLMLKFEGKSPKYTSRLMPGSHLEIIS